MKSRIGILLTDRTGDDQLALIELTSAGILRFRVIAEGMHAFALKAVERIVAENGLTEPLFVKHASQVKRGKLPPEVLQREAEFYANTLNHQTPLLRIGGKTIKATMVQFSTRNPN